MDGIDAVVADFSQSPPKTAAARTLPFDAKLSGELAALRHDPVSFPAGRLARLDALMGDALAHAALAVIDQAGLEADDIRAIGSHGQTVLHDPDHVPPTSLQIGDPHRIVALTGIVTVADFRRTDLAANGQGAPLAPLLHKGLLAHPGQNRVVVNLGGIANLTILPTTGEVSGFDTGPANCLLDHWYRSHHADPFDERGRWAASGRVDEEWLEILLRDEYFRRRPPKSTGIEYFSPQWLQERLPVWASARPNDVQATLRALTVESIARTLEDLPAEQRPERLIVCGGGVHNRALMDHLSSRMAPARTLSSADYQLDPDHIEGLLFAWLARERLANRPVQTSAITGAAHDVLAGVVFERSAK
jgi:anhydro-N-acetylmuramic acid kinase